MGSTRDVYYSLSFSLLVVSCFDVSLMNSVGVASLVIYKVGIIRTLKSWWNSPIKTVWA